MTVRMYEGTFIDDDPVRGPNHAREDLETAREISSLHHLEMALAGSKYHGLGLEKEVTESEIRQIAEKSILGFLKEAITGINTHWLERAKEENDRYKIFTESEFNGFEKELQRRLKEYENLRKIRHSVYDCFRTNLQLPVAVATNTENHITLKYPKNSNSYTTIFFENEDNLLSNYILVSLIFSFKNKSEEKTREKLYNLAEKHSTEFKEEGVLLGYDRWGRLVKKIPLPETSHDARQTAKKIVNTLEFYKKLLEMEPLLNEIKWGACGQPDW